MRLKPSIVMFLYFILLESMSCLLSFVKIVVSGVHDCMHLSGFEQHQMCAESEFGFQSSAFVHSYDSIASHSFVADHVAMKYI